MDEKAYIYKRDRASYHNPGPRAFTPGYRGDPESALMLYAKQCRDTRRISFFQPTTGNNKRDRASLVLLRAIDDPRDDMRYLNSGRSLVNDLWMLGRKLRKEGYTVTVLDSEYNEVAWLD